MSDPVVSTEWLADHIDQPGLVVLDASWHMPGAERDARAEFLQAHIPGALFFDIDEISDHASPLPHMLPDAPEFAIHARRLGVSINSIVVVYDSVGLFSAPRAWWMFRVMGHDSVKVLSGGLPQWVAEDRAIETGWRVAEHGDFKADLKPELVSDLNGVEAALTKRSWQVLDARAAARFRGELAEPRVGLRSGHMPGALSVPASTLVENGALAPALHLGETFNAAGVDTGSPTIASCGSGISAATIVLALARLGRWDAAIYDGSWTEWGGRPETAVVTGP